jgi:hypothetical protein
MDAKAIKARLQTLYALTQDVLSKAKEERREGAIGLTESQVDAADRVHRIATVSQSQKGESARRLLILSPFVLSLGILEGGPQASSTEY